MVTDGVEIYKNTTGNPGMATAGSGDVLTGIIASFLAQNENIFKATQTGAFLHGKAGDFAKSKFNETALIASDIIEALKFVI